MDPAPENFYELLGVNVNASTEAIRKAWRLAAWENHPDLRWAQDEVVRRENEKVMQQINEAYQTLTHPEKRRRYDLEMGLLPARCSLCGKDGNLRLAENGGVVSVCDACRGVTRVSPTA